ncbi:MAG: carbonic anhydrase [Desulfurivibrionaceae bacterium]
MSKKLIICSFIFLGLIFLVMPTWGKNMHPSLKKRVGIPPFKVIRKILATNLPETTTEKHFQEGAAPYLTWLADSEPRLSSSFILPDGRQMITVRNPGGQLAISLGSLNYGICELHTPVLLITGVADSRHVNSYLQGYHDLDRFLRLDLDHLHPALNREAEINLEQESPAEKLLRLVETNVDYQVEQAIRYYRERIEDGRLVVIGSVFDTANHYKKGKNKLIITNINSKKGEEMWDLRLIRQLKPELRQYIKKE